MNKEREYTVGNQRISINRRSAKSVASTAPAGKLPPQAPDFEQAVLGALMLEKNSLTTIIGFLKSEHFYVDKHKMIYAAITHLFSNSDPVDALTVINQLRKTGELELIGGIITITDLTNRVASASNIEYHARIIMQKYLNRCLIEVASETLSKAYDESNDIFELLDQTEQELFKLSEDHLRKNADSITNLLKKSIQEIEDLKNKTDGITGVPSGFTALDQVTGGWQKSDLIIVAARPSMGKTAFILTAVRNAAVQKNKAVAIFSLEMSSLQLTNRLLSGEAELNSDKLRKGYLNEADWKQLHAKIGLLSQAPIFIDDTPALSILELRGKCRRLKQQHNIELIVVDYLQLMQGSTDKGGNREQEISQISRALKNIAKELNVPVIALSQLSRAVETRGGDKRPMLSDLRESGSIEQDADMVMFLYRPEYYNLTIDDNGNSTVGLAEVLIKKNRNGSLSNIPLRFIGKYAKFTDLEQNFATLDATGSMRALKPNETFNADGSISVSSKANDPEDFAH